eukprot:gene8304-128_t
MSDNRQSFSSWFKIDPKRMNFPTKKIITLKNENVTALYTSDEYVYVGTDNGKIYKYFENNELEHDLIKTFETPNKKQITKISTDEKFKLLFFQDEKSIGILNSSDFQFKKDFKDENYLQNGQFGSDFTLFHQDSVITTNKKTFLVYDYTNLSFKKLTQQDVPFPINYFFSVGDFLVTYFKKYNVYNIGQNFGKISSDHVFEQVESSVTPSLVFLTNRNWKSDSFLAYSFADKHGDPIYLEDNGKKLPTYVPNTNHMPGKFSDLKFSSEVEKAEISIPFVAGLSRKDDHFSLEFKNIFNERSTDKSTRDKYQSTKDPYPIEIKTKLKPQLSSNYFSFYYSTDNTIFKIRIPSVDGLITLLEKDGLQKAAKKLEEIKRKKEIINQDVFQNSFVRQSISMQDSKMIQNILSSMYTPSTSPRTLGKELQEKSSPRPFGESKSSSLDASSPRKQIMLELERKKDSPKNISKDGYNESPTRKFSYLGKEEDSKKNSGSNSDGKDSGNSSARSSDDTKEKTTFKTLVRTFTKFKENKEREEGKKSKSKPSLKGSSPNIGSITNGDFNDTQSKERKSEEIVIPRQGSKIQFNRIPIPIKEEEHLSSQPKTPKTPKTPKGMGFLLTPREEEPVVDFAQLSSEYGIGRLLESFHGENPNELTVERDELVIIVQQTNFDTNGWTLCFYKEREGYLPSTYVEEINFKSFQKRKDIVKEFITTERTYVKNLNHLNNHFVVPLAEKNLISEDVHKKLFSCLKIVLGINVLFLNKLQEIAKKDYVTQDFELSSLLLEYSQAFKLYTDYIVGFDLSSEILKKERENNSKFAAFLKEKMQELKQKDLLVDIQSYLVLPVQRLPRYRLFLEDLLRSTPINESAKKYDQLTSALDEISGIVSYCNEKMREAGQVRNMKELQKKFNFTITSAKKIVREKKKEEECKIVINQTKIINNFSCCILFNDELFISLKKELLSQVNAIHLFFDDKFEMSFNESTKGIVLSGSNLVKEIEEKIEIQMLFEEKSDFDSWWNTFDELLNSY